MSRPEEIGKTLEQKADESLRKLADLEGGIEKRRQSLQRILDEISLLGKKKTPHEKELITSIFSPLAYVISHDEEATSKFEYFLKALIDKEQNIPHSHIIDKYLGIVYLYTVKDLQNLIKESMDKINKYFNGRDRLTLYTAQDEIIMLRQAKFFQQDFLHLNCRLIFHLRLLRYLLHIYMKTVHQEMKLTYKLPLIQPHMF